jgi:hypothetical protein
MQLEAATRGFNDPPRRLCAKCVDEIGRLEDKAVACKYMGCAGTWTWSRESQLSAARKKRSGVPNRACDKCRTFIGEAETLTLACAACDAPITWPKEHQLMVSLGAWSKPTHCSDCRSAGKSLEPEPPVTPTDASEEPQ